MIVGQFVVYDSSLLAQPPDFEWSDESIDVHHVAGVNLVAVLTPIATAKARVSIGTSVLELKEDVDFSFDVDLKVTSGRLVVDAFNEHVEGTFDIQPGDYSLHVDGIGFNRAWMTDKGGDRYILTLRPKLPTAVVTWSANEAGSRRGDGGRSPDEPGRGLNRTRESAAFWGLQVDPSTDRWSQDAGIHLLAVVT